MMEAAIIAHECPGFGDPFALTIEIWNGVLREIVAKYEARKNGR